VVHVTAVWRPERSTPRTLRIGPRTPRSALDRLVLAWARARADAVLTSGRNLRAEPELSLAHPGGESGPLGRWRRETLAREAPAWVAVLTRTGDVDLRHPALAPGRRRLLFTGAAAAAGLTGAARRAGVEIRPRLRPGPRDAVACLRRELGARTVLVELGPSTSRLLYRRPCRVDELLLAEYRGPAPPAEVLGGAFLDAERIEALLGPPRARCAREEPSGPWRFTRYRRAAPPDPDPG